MPKLRIAYPFPQIPYNDRAKIQSTVPIDLDRYLFTRVFPEAGHQAAMVAIFFKKFYAECLKRGIGLPPGETDPNRAVWDEDNESRGAQVLEDMNFNPPKAKKTKS